MLQGENDIQGLEEKEKTVIIFRSYDSLPGKSATLTN